ncbi:hypothetical protein SG34_005985 [Thalassomonas viridans]|uniref:Uncharacterized protein n=1 Tax=Thalassomonas viridans TaxID=137584 RepID=A0AAE9Z4I6_9GAMM|nr:hypothetical protein [Thalassomonas viridans]WDE06468.1 hypothetical protein SG34_005985 [Thalassomonas viridans]
MSSETLQATTMLATSLAALAAILSGICAFFSYKLARNIQNDMKSDECIIIGTPIHPELKKLKHERCVLMCALFNKSKRKAFINSVEAYDRQGNILDVTWAGEIDQIGIPQNPSQLVGVVDSANLYVRSSDGKEVEYMELEVSHSFSDEPCVVIYDPSSDWDENDG